MRRIGLLGGMSWESSVEYERVINQEVRRRLGGVHSADMVIRSFDFADVEQQQSAGDWDAAADLLHRGACDLVAAGAEVLALCTNTMHKVADAVAGIAGTTFVHIADPTAAAAHSIGAQRVGLLGTRYTMEEPFLADRLRERGIDVVIPEPDDLEIVHRVIYDELVRGVINESSRRAYQEVMARLVQRGAQAVVAGCTEIELLVGADDAVVPLLPTAKLHALAIVDAALG